jgi:hypothetical protein
MLEGGLIGVPSGDDGRHFQKPGDGNRNVRMVGEI